MGKGSSGFVEMSCGLGGQEAFGLHINTRAGPRTVRPVNKASYQLPVCPQPRPKRPCRYCLQVANKLGETPLSVAGENAAALRRAGESGMEVDG